MIIILNGSVGVGKTAVSWSLQRRFDKSVMLDGDYIGAVHPFEIYDDSRTIYLYKTIAHLIRFHKDNGYNNFVFNYVFENTKQLKMLLDLLRPIDNAILSFWLKCSETEQKDRICLRSTDQYEWELKRFVELNNILDKSSKKGNIGFLIDTTGLSIEKVTDKIWNEIKRTT